MNPDAIFFDLGMVLVTFDWNLAIPLFGQHNQNNTRAIKKFLADPQHDAFERGELTGEAFFEIGRTELNFQGTRQQFKTIWNEIFADCAENLEWVRELARHYPLYVLSNTNPWHAEYLQARSEWLNLFTARFYSYELGVRKPDPRIYEIALARAGVKPARALFIDDRLENIKGAQAVGMQTLYAPTPADLHRELSKLFPELAEKIHEPLSR